MQKFIPFHKSYIKKEEISGAVGVLKSGWHTMGAKTIEFENKFKDYTGAKHAIFVNSCTAALHLSLEAIGIKEGDEVLIPAITFTATAEVVCYFKAKPVFVDIDQDTMNIDPCKIEEKITKKTKAIITVDFAGQPVDYDEIKKIARKHKLFIIEDAAHTLPSLYKGSKIGTIADITCFSFYATKTLSTIEGGMITTENERWAARMKTMRLHGMNKDAWKRYSKEGSWFYEITGAGFKYSPTDISAAIGIAQLNRLEFLWEKRAKIAQAYNKAFAQLPEVMPLKIKEDRQTSFHLYVLKLNLEKLKIDRNQFILELNKRSIGTSVHFIPLYRHPFYRDTFKLKKKDWPVSEWIFERILSLPIFPEESKAQVKYITSSIREIIEKNKK